jgi:hypothetical protein
MDTTPNDTQDGLIYASGANAQLSFLLGEVLTIIDASTEGEKNKAIKDLIKDKFSKRQNYITQITTPPTGEVPEKFKVVSAGDTN